MTGPILTGLLVGIAFGFALQRGRFCMNSAFRDIVTMKDYTLLKTVALALLVSMLGFGIMAMTNIIVPNPKPILWGGNLIGSFIFGIGMVLAGGCASGITYRVGEGMVGAMTAVLGLTLAAIATAMGFLKPVKRGRLQPHGCQHPQFAICNCRHRRRDNPRSHLVVFRPQEQGRRGFRPS